MTTLNESNVEVSKIERKKREFSEKPHNVHVPDDIDELFTEASTEFADVVKQYVEDKIQCFAENIINVKEDYLTFVCSTTGHKNIKDLLESEFGDSSMCKNNYCDDLTNDLMDKMLAHEDNGLDPTIPHVRMDIPVGTDLVRNDK